MSQLGCFVISIALKNSQPRRAIRFPGVSGLANCIEGTVTEINAAGDLVTDISNQQLTNVPRDQSVSVAFGPYETLGIYAPDHGEPDSTLIAVIGSSDFLELGIVGMSIHEMLKVGVGEKVEVKW